MQRKKNHVTLPQKSNEFSSTLFSPTGNPRECNKTRGKEKAPTVKEK